MRGRPRNLHEALEQLASFAIEARCRLLRHLGQEAFRDLPDRAAADRRNPGDGQEVLDECPGILVVGPGQRRKQA